MFQEVDVTIGEQELKQMFAKHLGIKADDITFWYVSSIIKKNASIRYRQIPKDATKRTKEE